MKKIIKILLMPLIIFGGFCHGQDVDKINHQMVRIEIEKVAQWQKLDRHREPVTNEQAKEFFMYIGQNPLIQHFEIDTDVAHHKIRAALNLYRNIDDEMQRKKIINLFMNTLGEIQKARDTLGVNPNSETEGYLYVNPPLAPKDPEENDGEATLSSPRFHEVINKKIQSRIKIENLEQIHGYLYGVVTSDLEIPLEGISPKLERSPAEKARTKDFLEDRAAALGRIKPEPEDAVIKNE